MLLNSKQALDGGFFGAIVEDPHKFGAPTFEEFAANPEFYRKKFFGDGAESALVAADGKSELLAKYETKRVFELWTGTRQFKFEKLEELQKAAFNEGIDLRSLVIVPEILPEAGQKCKILVRFMTREQKAKRDVEAKAEE